MNKEDLEKAVKLAEYLWNLLTNIGHESTTDAYSLMAELQLDLEEMK